jgi:hypothetical protein
MTVSGEYNGDAIDFACNGSAGVGYNLVQSSPRYQTRGVDCTQDPSSATSPFVSVLLGQPVFAMLPSTFEIKETETSFNSFVGISWPDRMLNTDADDFSSTYTLEFRIAGEAMLGPGRSAGKMSEFAKGTFAVSVMPKPDCKPDANGFGCDTVKLCGTFYARTQTLVQ